MKRRSGSHGPMMLLTAGLLVVFAAVAAMWPIESRAQNGNPSPAPSFNNPMHLTIKLQPAHTSMMVKPVTVYITDSPPSSMRHCKKQTGTVTIKGNDENNIGKPDNHPGKPQTNIVYYVCK